MLSSQSVTKKSINVNVFSVYIYIEHSNYIIQLCPGITRSRVPNEEVYEQR